MKFELNDPFEYGSEIVTELEVSKVKAKDLFGLSKDPNFEEMFKIACSCANEPVSKLQNMSAKDALRFVEVINGFLEDSQETGKS